MNSALSKLLKCDKKRFLTKTKLIYFSNKPPASFRPNSLQKPRTIGEIEPYGWFMLIIPVASFGLGVWQIQRKGWKENLIAELAERTSAAPRELPQSLDEIEKLEFYPVHVRGTFLHDKELYMGPRGIMQKEEKSGGLIGGGTQQGYLVVTPFKLADREETILVNRGWVPAKQLKPSARTRGQTDETVDLIGLVRLNEHRPNFAMKNKEGSNLYFYRDLESMCAATGASPIFLDQTRDYNVTGGPIGGQTRVTLRNEHLSYIITWFSLSAFTSYMWLKKFVLRG